MKVKDIPKFEKLNTLNVNVFELTKTVLTPIHINTNCDQPQIDLLLFEKHYCLITKLHCLVNNNSSMKWVCRRCLTAFSSEQILFNHTSRCINQQLTNITFSWKDHLKFEDTFMKMPLPIKVYADFECINPPTTRNDQNVFFKQIPIAVGFYLISPFGNKYCSYFGERCTAKGTEGHQSSVTLFVNETLTLENIADNNFETNLELEITIRAASQSVLALWTTFYWIRTTSKRSWSPNRQVPRSSSQQVYFKFLKSQVRLFPYFSIISVALIVILFLKNS